MDGPGFYFMISMVCIVLFFSFLKAFKGQGTGSQKSKKSSILFIWFFIFSCLSVLFSRQVSTKYFSSLAIPSAVFCAGYFLNIKKQGWAEFLFLLLIGSVFVNLIAGVF